MTSNCISHFFRKHGGTILTILSAAGVVGTAYLSGKASIKAKEELETLDKDAPLKEKAKALAPIYVPTAAVGAATILCMFGANGLNRKQQASMLAAGALMEQTYKKYRDKAEELIGDKIDKLVVDDLNEDVPLDKEERLFYYNYYEDGEVPEYGSYFPLTPEKVLKAEMELNRIFILRRSATLNDFFKLLGLKKVEGGDNLGWSIDLGSEYYGYSWIDFEHFDAKLEDGMECTIITTPFPPTILA